MDRFYWLKVFAWASQHHADFGLCQIKLPCYVRLNINQSEVSFYACTMSRMTLIPWHIESAYLIARGEIADDGMPF